MREQDFLEIDDQLIVYMNIPPNIGHYVVNTSYIYVYSFEKYKSLFSLRELKSPKKTIEKSNLHKLLSKVTNTQFVERYRNRNVYKIIISIHEDIINDISVSKEGEIRIIMNPVHYIRTHLKSKALWIITPNKVKNINSESSLRITGN